MATALRPWRALRSEQLAAARGECCVLWHMQGLDSRGFPGPAWPEGQETVTLSHELFLATSGSRHQGGCGGNCRFPNPEPAKSPSNDTNDLERKDTAKPVQGCSSAGRWRCPVGIHRHLQKAPQLDWGQMQPRESPEDPSSFFGSRGSAVQWDPVGTRRGVRKGTDLGEAEGLSCSRCSSSGH